jgi:hypothetical protein
METTERGNPNVCADCVRWLEDPSPVHAAHQGTTTARLQLLDVDPVETLADRADNEK